MKIQDINKYRFKNGKFVLDVCNLRRIALLVLLCLAVFTYVSSQHNFWIVDTEPQITRHEHVDTRLSAYVSYIQKINPNLPSTEVNTVAKCAIKYSEQLNIDPDLAMGLMYVESRYKKYAISKVGALSYTQVLPEMHIDEINALRKQFGHADLFDAEFNIALGLGIYNTYKLRHKTVKRTLLAYNGALHKETTYPEDILKAAEAVKQFREYFVQEQKGVQYASL